MVSIIILSYNTRNLLDSCLESIKRNIGFKHEVIVVDNASKDGSAAYIRKKHKDIKIIQNRENEGFAKGCNLGSQEASGEYILFLNSDTVINDKSIKKLLESAKYEEVGVVGGILKNKDGSRQRSFGRDYNLVNLSIMLFGGDRLENAFLKIPEKTSEVDWVSGGCMLVNTEHFRTLNGFDERFFMYFEDVEFCYRTRKVGKKVMLNPDVSVLHLGQASSSKSFAIEQIYKGVKYFYQKHNGVWENLMMKTLLYKKAFISIVFGMIKGDTQSIETYRRAMKTI